MKKLIEYIRSCFCHHEWILLHEGNVRFDEWHSMPVYHQWIFQCKKCGELKYISAKK